MLNISNTNNYLKQNINFKSGKDYSKIYKELEKITITQDDRIIPKANVDLKKSASKIFSGVGKTYSKVKQKLANISIATNSKPYSTPTYNVGYTNCPVGFNSIREEMEYKLAILDKMFAGFWIGLFSLFFVIACAISKNEKNSLNENCTTGAQTEQVLNCKSNEVSNDKKTIDSFEVLSNKNKSINDIK